MTSKLARDVMRRPTLVSYGSDHQPRLLPLLESALEGTPDVADSSALIQDVEGGAESSEDQESVVNSDDYDTDLDGKAQSLSAGLTMWPMWKMPRASGLRGASGSREIFLIISTIQYCADNHTCKWKHVRCTHALHARITSR